MFPFERQYSFLLDLITRLEQQIFHIILSFWIAYNQCPMARCQRKRANQYRIWQDFRLREVDVIWRAQRWERCDWLWPCEGERLQDWRQGDSERIADFLDHSVSFAAGIYRGSRDVCWIRAPITMSTIVATSQWRIYQGVRKDEFFVIQTFQPGLLIEESEAGQVLGSLCGESWIYMVVLRSSFEKI